MRHPITRFMALLAALAVVGAACSSNTSSSFRTNGEPSTTIGSRIDRPVITNGQNAVLASHSLVPFEACDPFLDYVTEHAVDLVGPYGLEDPFYGRWWGGWDLPMVEMTMEDAATAPVAPGGQNVEYSGTNVQVLGVDEPDMVKTDGERIVVLS